MIRYLQGADPLGILGGGAYALGVRKLQQEPARLEAIQAKPNVPDDASANLHTALRSLAIATDRLRKKVANAQAAVPDSGFDALGITTFSRMAATQEVNHDEGALVRSSQAPLGLELSGTPTQLEATEEMNSAATWYEKVHLPFTSGTAAASLSGVYAGGGLASQASALIFRFNADAELGALSTYVEFEVLDQDEQPLFTYAGNLAAGDEVYLGDDLGLTVSFSSGTVVQHGTATLAVSNSTPTTVDLDAVFDDVDPNLRPRFEGGAQVMAGSFEVNGTLITVNADDSIRAVLARIEQLVPELEATVSGDRVYLSTLAASGSPITVGNDTSGFLGAVKLEGASSVVGALPEDLRALEDTAAFSGVLAGSFWVNGVEIEVDPTADSLQDLIDRVNNSGAGVTAAYDAEVDTLSFASAGTVLDLAGDTSGFLAAAGVEDGLHSTQVNPDGAFNVTGFAGARLAPGVSVGAGSFTLNGVEIEVFAHDTLNAVLTRMTNSAADVTATYDESTEKVTLARKTGGPYGIHLGADSSGFLAAVKLDETALTSVGVFGGEHDGQRVAYLRAGSEGTARIDYTELLAELSAEVEHLNRVLKSLASDPQVDPALKSAVRAALSKVALPEGIRALDAQLTLDSEALDAALRSDPQGVLQSLSDREGLQPVLGEALEEAQQEAAFAPAELQLADLDARTMKLVPGVVTQAEVLVQGRMLTVLLSIPQPEPPPEKTAEAAKAKKAYEEQGAKEKERAMERDAEPPAKVVPAVTAPSKPSAPDRAEPARPGSTSLPVLHSS